MILVVDHYDSFVYNLVQLVEGLGHRTEVVRSDEEPTDALLARRPDAVILSPGPGRPEAAGCMVELTAALDPATPVLGVCLGHQAIGAALGGRVDRGPEPVHGKASAIHHTGEDIFDGVPDPFEGGRYRVWRLYMAASARMFEAGRLQVHQVLAVQSDGGASGLPLRRADTVLL